MNDQLTNMVWSATALAADESKVAAAALSVRQRKILSLLSTPTAFDALVSSSGLPAAEVESTLSRLSKLGLAKSNTGFATAASSNLDASSMRAQGAPTAASKAPLIAGGIALTAIAAGIWWFMGSSKPIAPTAASAPSAPQTVTAPAPSAPIPGAASPANNEVTTISVFAPAAAPATPEPVAPVAAAKERETPTKDASKEAAKEAAKAAAEAAKAAKQASPPPAAPAPSVVAAAPPPTPAPTPATTPSAPAAAQPASVAPPPPAPAPVAAAPTPAPRPAAPREGALISKVDPAFPRNSDASSGSVRARLTINASGAVTNVEIVEANPRRVFDNSVRAALSQWRYEGTGETQTKLVDINFNR